MARGGDNEGKYKGEGRMVCTIKVCKRNVEEQTHNNQKPRDMETDWLGGGMDLCCQPDATLLEEKDVVARVGENEGKYKGRGKRLTPPG